MAVAPRSRRRRSTPGTTGVATAVAVGAAAAAAGSLFLPWAASGRAERSGFELARVADSAGLADDTWSRLLLGAVWLSPALVGVAWLALVLGRRVAAAAASVAVAATVGAGFAVVAATDAVRPLPGAIVGSIAAGTSVAGSGLALWTARSGGRWWARSRGPRRRRHDG